MPRNIWKLEYMQKARTQLTIAYFFLRRMRWSANLK